MTTSPARSLTAILVCGSVIVTLAMGYIAAAGSFGQFLMVPIERWLIGGFVFFSHQIGSFFGVWLGGLIYDRTGNYDVVWMIAITGPIWSEVSIVALNELFCGGP